jgi:hypothetical protein
MTHKNDSLKFFMTCKFSPKNSDHLTPTPKNFLHAQFMTPKKIEVKECHIIFDLCI